MPPHIPFWRSLSVLAALPTAACEAPPHRFPSGVAGDDKPTEGIVVASTGSGTAYDLRYRPYRDRWWYRTETTETTTLSFVSAPARPPRREVERKIDTVRIDAMGGTDDDLRFESELIARSFAVDGVPQVSPKPIPGLRFVNKLDATGGWREFTWEPVALAVPKATLDELASSVHYLPQQIMLPAGHAIGVNGTWVSRGHRETATLTHQVQSDDTFTARAIDGERAEIAVVSYQSADTDVVEVDRRRLERVNCHTTRNATVWMRVGRLPERETETIRTECDLREIGTTATAITMLVVTETRGSVIPAPG